ncbi:DUF3644 domain-containing protein [Arhodomonas sp. SL1]|uniref:DUF3644 domain-containing protein n=1 Tax=Arhodomonas sp. SL1 TaxID=3425691 RepID=UPI003F881354
MADKSIDAMLAAMEIYNKPNFSYREESFSILAINAWELLLKARVLQLSGNKVSAILKYERRRKADGTRTEKRYRVKNRSGTHLSVGLFKSFDLITDEYGETINSSVRTNLELLCEIRDNSIHFLNKGFDLAKLVQEIGTACLRNYLVLARQWFASDLSEYNFFLMPLAFFGQHGEAQALSLNAEERRLIEYLRGQASTEGPDSPGDFNVSLRLDVKFSKSKSPEGQKVQVSNDPDATPVTLTEEDIREKYPWDYKILTTRLRKRYTDFKVNQDYHAIRKRLEQDERYCRTRFLDPGKRAGVGKSFYNPNIVREFDAFYTKS